MIKNVLSRISLLSISIIILSVHASCSFQNPERILIYQTEATFKKNKSELNKRRAIVKTAKSQIGIPYKYGGKTTKGFDCSGFTQFVMKQHGIDIGASS